MRIADVTVQQLAITLLVAAALAVGILMYFLVIEPKRDYQERLDRYITCISNAPLGSPLEEYLRCGSLPR